MRSGDVNRIQRAVDILRQAMRRNPDYAYSWHINIAALFYDHCSHSFQGTQEEILAAGHRAASCFMKATFGISTSVDMLENNTELEPNEPSRFNCCKCRAWTRRKYYHNPPATWVKIKSGWVCGNCWSKRFHEVREL
jgi:hypothetical protein